MSEWGAEAHASSSVAGHCPATVLSRHWLEAATYCRRRFYAVAVLHKPGEPISLKRRVRMEGRHQPRHGDELLGSCWPSLLSTRSGPGKLGVCTRTGPALLVTSRWFDS